MKKCVIITTINKPTEAIQKYSENKEYDLIVVGDSSTPDSLYKSLSCIYLSLDQQHKTFPELSELIPTKSYTRKNIGYAYAFKENYDIVHDTDDDNYHMRDSLDLKTHSDYTVTSSNHYANIYKLFSASKVWPRGLPLRYMDTFFTTENNSYKCPVVQGLVNGDPDVDAIFRISNSIADTKFDTFEIINDKTYALAPFTFCPFNSQNTYWLQKDWFHLMYLPNTVSMRFTDILRSYIVEHQLWQNNLSVKFTQPTAIQTRNPHNLAQDLMEEIEVFQYIEIIAEWLLNNKNASVVEIYKHLLSQNIIKLNDLQTLKAWYKIFI